VASTSPAATVAPSSTRTSSTTPSRNARISKANGAGSIQPAAWMPDSDGIAAVCEATTATGVTPT
jgi:hypothetical protein